MTIRTNARLAGWVLLLYIATGITSMILSGRAFGGAEGTAEKLANIAEHAVLMRIDILLTLLQAAYAVTLAVTLYALTRDQDRDLAVAGLCCRAAEGVINALAVIRSLALLSFATAGTAAVSTEAAADQALAGFLFRMGGWTALISATCFAGGSTLFAWLFLRARSIPVPLAWIGVVASVLLVVALPLQTAGFIGRPLTDMIWIPMILFEVPLGFWLIIKGVRTQPA